VPAIAFTTNLTTPGGSWVVVPMGTLTSQTETFWELFYRPTTSTKWTEVTPPGVADNGGLAIASEGYTPGSLTVGFEPSVLLGFSPLAATSNGGKSWSAGTLQTELQNVPDAVAASSSGEVLALGRQGGGEVYENSAALGGWTKLVARAELADSTGGSQCGLGALTSVAIETNTTQVIGGDCSRPGVVGLFSTSNGGSWQLSGPRLPHGLATGTAAVLRLYAGGAGTSASVSGLVAVKQGGAVSILAFGRTTPSSSWYISPALKVPSTDTTLSTGYDGAGGGFAVLERSSSGETTLSSVALAKPWTTQRDLPKGTSAVAFGPGGGIDAITHTPYRFESWARAGNGAWTLQQTINVPVPTGSSS
jgi:hypothetical protein